MGILGVAREQHWKTQINIQIIGVEKQTSEQEWRGDNNGKHKYIWY